MRALGQKLREHQRRAKPACCGVSDSSSSRSPSPSARGKALGAADACQERGAAAPVLAPARVHDVPVVGWFTSAAADSFAGLVQAAVQPEDVRNAFHAVDASGRGKLDRTGVADALRCLGKAERQVQKLVDATATDELDLPAFQELVLPGPKPWLASWGSIPVPNVGKIIDVPVLGNSLCMIGDLVAQPVDSLHRSAWRAFHPSANATEAILREQFQRVDKEGSGTMNRCELAVALRQWGQTEIEIKEKLDASVGEELSFYEFKKLVRGPKYEHSVVSYVPFAGPALAAHVVGHHVEEIPDRDLRDAFDHIDRKSDRSGKLDRTDICDVLRELAIPEPTIQNLVQGMEEEEVDFQGFAALLRPTSEPFFTDLGGVPLPNPAKIHDVPGLGSAASVVRDATKDTYRWTVGAGYKAWTMHSCSDEELKAKFDELDAEGQGLLTKRQLAVGLRSLGLSERQIQEMRDSVGDSVINWSTFRIIFHERRRWSA